MGLYDSRDGTSDDGSTAQVTHAALYNLPCMLGKNKRRGRLAVHARGCNAQPRAAGHK